MTKELIDIANSSIYFTYKNKVSLQPILSSHLHKLMCDRNDFSTCQNLGDIWPITDFNQKNWFENISNDKNKLYFSIGDIEKNAFVGMARLNPIDWINSNACVGVDIFKPERNKGYGTLAMKCIVKYCFDYLNMNRCWLFVLDSNEPAKHIYEKIGFKVEGKQREGIYRDGKYVDYVMMSMLKSEYEELKKNGKL